MVDQIVGACQYRWVLSRADIFRYYRDKRNHEKRPRRLRGTAYDFGSQINPLRNYREDVQKAIGLYSNMGVFGRSNLFKWFSDLAFERRFRDEKQKDKMRRLLGSIRRMRLDNPPHMLTTLWPVRYDEVTKLVGTNPEDVERAEKHGVVFDRLDFADPLQGTYHRIYRHLMSTRAKGLWTMVWTEKNDDSFAVYLSDPRDVAELVLFRLTNGHLFGDQDAA